MSSLSTLAAPCPNRLNTTGRPGQIFELQTCSACPPRCDCQRLEAGEGSKATLPMGNDPQLADLCPFNSLRTGDDEYTNRQTAIAKPLAGLSNQPRLCQAGTATCTQASQQVTETARVPSYETAAEMPQRMAIRTKASHRPRTSNGLLENHRRGLTGPSTGWQVSD